MDKRFYTDQGSGPVVAFFHGSLMDKSMFAPQVEAFSGKYRVITADHRARTDQFNTEYDLFDLCDDHAVLLDELGVDKFVLAGMSMGGFMGLEFVLRYPERLDGLKGR